jgi:hypothetical protein
MKFDDALSQKLHWFRRCNCIIVSSTQSKAGFIASRREVEWVIVPQRP